MEIQDAAKSFFIGLGLFLTGGALTLATSGGSEGGLIFTGLLGVGGIYLLVGIVQFIAVIFISLSGVGRIILSLAVLGVIGGGAFSFSTYFNEDNTQARINKERGIIWGLHLKAEQTGSVRAVALTPEGNILFGGRYKSKSNGKNAYFGLINEAGELLWDRVIDGEGDEEITSVAVLNGGGAVLTGYSSTDSLGDHDGIIIRVSGTGEILWRKRYGAKKSDWFDKVLVLPSGDILVGGFTASKGDRDGDIFLLRLDSKGEIIWENTYGGDGYGALHSFFLTDRNSLILAGETRRAGNVKGDGYLAEINLSGEMIAEESYGLDGHDAFKAIAAGNNGDVLLSGHLTPDSQKNYGMWYLHLDKDREILNDGYYSVTENYNALARSLVLMPDNHVLIGGYAHYRPTRQHSMVLFKINLGGEITWKRDFGADVSGAINTVTLLPENKAILAGYRENEYGVNSMYVMKAANID